MSIRDREDWRYELEPHWDLNPWVREDARFRGESYVERVAETGDHSLVLIICERRERERERERRQTNTALAVVFIYTRHPQAHLEALARGEPHLYQSLIALVDCPAEVRS